MPGLWPGAQWRTSRTEFIDLANAEVASPPNEATSDPNEHLLASQVHGSRATDILEARLAQIAAIGQSSQTTQNTLQDDLKTAEVKADSTTTTTSIKQDIGGTNEQDNEKGSGEAPNVDNQGVENDEDNDDDGQTCLVCLEADADDLVRLLPCTHLCMCYSCFQEQKQDAPDRKVYCPICMQEAPEYRTQQEEDDDNELERVEREHALDIQDARARADEQLAGTHVENVLGFQRPTGAPLELGFFEITEDDLKKCFGVGLMGFFRQTRILFLVCLVLTVCSTPVVLTYLTSIREGARNPDSYIAAFEVELRKWSLPTCTRDTCRVFFAEFLALDNAGPLMAAFLVLWMGCVTRSTRRKGTGVFESPELNIAARTLLVIQAPHRTDAADRRELESFFRDLQLAQLRKRQRQSQSHGPRALFMREMTPPVHEIHITGVLNCSSDNLRFARAAERRLRLLADIQAHKKRLAKTSTLTKEFRQIEIALAASLSELRQLEYAYFDDLFLQEELGAVERTALHKVDFLFLTFESAAHARFARQLMHHDNRHWIWHHICLMLGAPLTRLRAIGSVEDVYPSNVDWFRLQDPHWYAQSGWPARCAMALVLLVAFNAVVGYYIWDFANDIGGNLAGGLFYIFWHKASRVALDRAFDWYGHPLRSFTLYTSVFVSVLAIDVPSYLGWPLVWSALSAYQRGPLTFPWWVDRILPNLVIAQAGHCILTIVWFLGLRPFSRFMSRILKGNAWTQYELDEDLCPPLWNLARAYMAMLRTAVLCVPYSGVCPWLAPLGAGHLAMLYFSEKLDFINAVRFPYRAVTSGTGVLAARVVELCIALRLGISALTIWILYDSPTSGAAPFEVVDEKLGLSLPMVSLAGVGIVLAVINLYRISVLRRASWTVMTLNGPGADPALAQAAHAARRAARRVFEFWVLDGVSSDLGRIGSFVSAVCAVRASMQAAEGSQLPSRWIAALVQASAQRRSLALGRGKRAVTVHMTAYATELVRIVTNQANRYCEEASAGRSSVRRLREDHLLKAIYALGFRRYYNRLKAAKASDKDDNGGGDDDDNDDDNESSIKKREDFPAERSEDRAHEGHKETKDHDASADNVAAGKRPRRAKKRAAKDISLLAVAGPATGCL
ncbi:Hypothetical Protein FCC1311_061402 [Hondaea fermentalgiana]|uniref:RING-type domain-containing protein n=1 Tax=Hondaea fermentalgiana TaxID=2315210 RepID=A0A2R5GGC0_9STRA|nr:Hypothetical Protein FCC1311_061402 [Hondaea fermentalgiana]|eukprot:GBG29920.1 Hypothetical Protein FCC1311_061402 [Hondaea fermentalgiana]